MTDKPEDSRTPGAGPAHGKRAQEVQPSPSARTDRRDAIRRYWPLGVLAITPILIWILSKDQVKVKPIVWVSLGYVVLFGLVVLLWRRRPRFVDYLLAGVAGIAATHVLFYPGFPQGHDIVTHLWGTYGFFKTIRAGVVLPLWVHHLGLGMPFPMFYPPLAFFLMLPFEAFHLPVFDSFKYGFVLYSVLSGLSMYYVVYRWTSSRAGALVAAAAYCFAPYHLLESQYRVAVAEAAAMAVLPMFFYTMDRAVRAPSWKTWRAAATWTAVLVMTHPLSLSMAGIGMGLWTLAMGRFRFDQAMGRRLGLLFLVSVLGLVAAAYYVVPVAAESRYVSITNTLGGRKPLYARYGLNPQELVIRRAWSKWQRAEPHGSKSENNEMPFYFGLTLLTLLPLAWAGRSRKAPSPLPQTIETPTAGGEKAPPDEVPDSGNSPNPNTGGGDGVQPPGAPPPANVVPGLMAMTLGSLALTLYPLDVVFARFPPMTILQFPWRFLAIATCGAAALAGFATRNLLERWADRSWAQVVPVGLVALMVVDFFPYQGASSWHRPYDGVYRIAEHGKGLHKLPFRVDHLSYPPAQTNIDLSLLRRVYPEYFTPKTRRTFKNAKKDTVLERACVGMAFKGRKRRLHPRPYAEFFPADGGKPIGLEFTRAGERITVKLPGKDGRLEIKEQWFPGWMATLGKRHFQVKATKDGVMKIPLHMTDTGTLQLDFSRTRWDRLLGALLSVATLVLLWWPAPKRFQWLRHGTRGDIS